MQNPQGGVIHGETASCLNEVAEKGRSRIVDVVGGHGPWQFRYWATFFLASLCCSLHLFSTLPLNNLSACECAGTTENRNGSVSSPSMCDVSSCHNRTGEELWGELTEPCFSPTPRVSLQRAEEDTSGCSNAAAVFYSKCLFVVGSFVGTFTTYPLVRRYGRRSVSLASCFLLCACSFAGVWASAPGPFLVLKLVLSTCLVSVYLTAAFSLADCLAVEFRLLYFCTAHVSWGLAHFLLPFLVWIMPASYNLLLTAPCFLLLVILCFLPETAQSYASRGLVSRAHRVMRSAARCNGYPLHRVSLELLQEETQEDGESRSTWKLKEPRALLQHIGLFLVGFVSTFTYFAMMWLAEWLPPAKRAALFSLLGTSEVAAALVLLSLSHLVPLRRVWALTSTLSSLFLIVLYVKGNKAKAKFSRGFHLVQMFFASASWTLVLLHALTRPPNRVKCLSAGFCAGLLAATLADAQKLTSWNPVLLLVMGAPNLMLAVLAGFTPHRYLDGLNV